MRLLPRKDHFLECVIGVEVFHDAPRKTEVLVLRPLASNATHAPDPAVTVPGTMPGTLP